MARRGKPVARLKPIVNESADGDDPFDTLSDVSDSAAASLSNSQIDAIVHGQ